MKDILNKALAANADTDAVAEVIDAIINAPHQDAQPKTDKEAAIKRSLAVEEALAKRHKALRKAVIDVITEAIFGSISVDDATDTVIGLVTAGRIIDVDIAKDAKLEHELGGNDRGAFEDGFEPIGVANVDANCAVNVDANCAVNADVAAKGKDNSDKWVFKKDAHGRMFKLVGANTDAPDELY